MNYEYCNGMTHTIKQGDTLYSISRMHKVPLGILLRANPYVDVYNLQIGDTICVPVKNQVCRPGMQCGPNMPERPMPRTNKDSDDNMYDKDENNEMYAKEDADMYADNDMYDIEDNDRYDRDNRRDRDDDDRRRYMGEDTDGMMMGVRDEERNDDGIRMSIRDEGRDVGSVRMNANDMTNNMGNRRVKYVSQSGDTLQDLFDRSAGGNETFWEMNSPERMYLLAGVAYHIIEKD